jgi:hypothetical protein
MIENPSVPSSIQRSFRDLSDAEVADIEKASLLARAGWRGSFGWDDLLRSRRVLIVSEAGAGKTHECRERQQLLWNAGEPAFFLDLATLANSSVREMLTAEEEQRLDAWLRSQSEVATFFLDSIDELKLTLGKFDQALKRLNKAIEGQLGRVRIVITTRPVPVDRELIARHLPIPNPAEAEPTAEAFADMIMNRIKKKPAEDAKIKEWRNVGLMPLSREQMRAFAILQRVTDPDALLEDIRRRDAEEFAQRPQDLIELCSDWREHHRIRSHCEQVETDVATKLKPSTERKERAPLSQEKAIEGARRLALAAMLTRKLTLRHSAESDTVQASEAALDVSKILPDWSADERSTLLERPLFGFASYGRVRFHHRSVVEYLAAKHLEVLLARGIAIKAVKRLLFTETAQGTRTVRPSMRPVAAWLALWRDTVFDEIVAVDPAVALDYGDPQSLRPAQRIRALEAYAARYGRGGWRGLNTPRIQVHRFASRELSETVNHLWRSGIENLEVRELLLAIIEAGKLDACADIAHEVAMDGARDVRERSRGIAALVQLNDPRLEALALSLETDPLTWPDGMARYAMLDLFPSHLPVPRLSKILRRVKESPRSVGELNYRLPREIETADLSPAYLDQLRDALTEIIAEGATWKHDKFPHLRTKRPDLMAALVAACRRQCIQGVRTEPWITSTLLAVRLSKDEYTEKDALQELRRALANLTPDEREVAFWKEDELLGRLHQSKDKWHRLFELSHNGGIQLVPDKDANWVRKRLSDSNEPLERREMMLWAEMLLLHHNEPNPREFLEGLKLFIADAPNLTAIIDSRLKPRADDPELQRLEAENAKLMKQSERRDAKAHASWVTFWRKIAKDPAAMFAPDRAEHTAWNLWQAMERSGLESRASGWNRRFIATQFGRDLADRLRTAMLPFWRKDKPTLRSERLEGQKDTFLVRWQFGLAAIAAEAEDPNWAKALSQEEAEQACRYAPLELNGFPSWLDGLAIAHTAAVDKILGEELSLSLRELADPNSHSIFLQNVSYASATVAAVFMPRIRAWLAESAAAEPKSNHVASKQHVGQAVQILMKHGSDEDRRWLESLGEQTLTGGLNAPFAGTWLPVLLQRNPVAGVDALENGLRGAAVSQYGDGVKWFAQLFGRDRGGVAVNTTQPAYTPQLLLRLVRLAYKHVRVGDDAHHEGSYSPDTRDDAERARNAVLSALLSTTGAEGWAAKLEMANDPLFAHFKDRAIALAQEKAAEEADNVPLKETEFAVLDKCGESPPSTREAMFALMRDRLDDIDDLLLQDVSPREGWASIRDERVLRRGLAHELRNLANHVYTVDQEGATADEKETDIRLRAAASGQQGTIELKIGDKDRSAAELRATLKNQLLTKYMAADECRAGCLVVSIASDKHWKHPDTGERLDFEGLLALLNEEAERLSQELGGAAKLMVNGLDLRPRLTTEKKARSKDR